MSAFSTNVSAMVLITLSCLAIVANSPVLAAGAPSPPLAIVGVWSSKCGSWVIASNNTACGPVSVGSTISVQVNLTAPVGLVNGYDLRLYYDPAFLNATGVDYKTNVVFSNPTLVIGELFVRGIVRLGEVCLACSNNSPSGALVNINFKILAVGVSPLTLAAGFIPSGFAQSYTLLSTPGGLAPGTADGYFTNDPVHLGPVARFRFSPASPKTGGQVTFYANASYDPDASTGTNNKGIGLYKWDFGGVANISPTAGSPTYSFTLGPSAGNFSVRLTVVDSDNNFEGMQTQLFTVTLNPFHDLVAQSITPTPSTVNRGDKVAVSIIVANNGTFPENYDLTVSYDNPTTVFGTQKNQVIAVGTTAPFSFTLDTSSLTPGNFYTLTANVTVLPSLNNTKGIDNLPGNNVRIALLYIRADSSPSANLLLIDGGVGGAVAVLSAVGLLLRKRRRAALAD